MDAPGQSRRMAGAITPDCPYVGAQRGRPHVGAQTPINKFQHVLERQRCAHYQLGRARRLVTLADAARYINRFGFCWLFAPHDRTLELPSLFEAVKGKRDAHIQDWDADSDRVWTWKSDLPAAKRAYYGKALVGKPVLISLKMLPAVLAALGIQDAERAYAEGALPHDAKRVYDVLARQGAQPTKALKLAASFVGKDGNTRFHHALDVLQNKLLVAPMGATAEGAGWHSQIFDLVSRWFPVQARAAAQLDRDTARRALVERYVKTVLAARPQALGRLFAIPNQELDVILDDLRNAKRVRVAEGWVYSKAAFALGNS